MFVGVSMPSSHSTRRKQMDRDTEIAKMYAALPNFKFDESEYIDEMHEYISSTYKEHYAKGKYQATDIILDSGHGEGFVMGNILKYWKRYGNKEGKNRKDLLKIIHYAIIMLYVHDHVTKGE